EDGWDTEPFTLQEIDGKLYGRGSTDDKGPVLCWLHVIEAYKAIGEDLPINIRDEYREDIGTSKLMHETKEELLMHRWRYPSLSIHGIEGAFYEPGAKTVIPRKVIGKFSIRLVPNQIPDEIINHVITYLNKVHADRGSPNPVK
ncbi:predicted protein, partial [Nematostella vectensis]